MDEAGATSATTSSSTGSDEFSKVGPGGIRLGVVGAHTQGYNSLSVGVSMIGEFSSVAPTSPMMASVGSVVGWKLGMYERNPLGLTTVVSGGSNKFPAGTIV